MSRQSLRFSGRDRRRQIMQVAAELFARQGYKGTTTREISLRAGVNEAIIFRHFRTKEELYWEVIDRECEIAKARGELEVRLESPKDDRAIFAGIAEDVIRRNAEKPALARLLLYSALENHRLSDRFFRKHVAERYEVLAEHIRERIRQGRFRKVDPLVAARGFFGMVIYHFLIQEVFGAKKYQRFDPEAVSRVLADIWLRGMLAAGEGGRNAADRRGRRRS